MSLLREEAYKRLVSSGFWVDYIKTKSLTDTMTPNIKTKYQLKEILGQVQAMEKIALVVCSIKSK